ncbi:MAG: M1 family metallopeptidase, partial [Lysobacteraceae bacterium]
MHRKGFNVVLAVSALLAWGATTVIATAHAATPQRNGAQADARTPTQLPRDVRPTHYAITITPDAARLMFKGEVTIDIDVLMPTRRIVLNALDLEFAQVDLISTDAARTPHKPHVGIDPQAQTASFAFDSVLVPGRYRLTMHYTGKIGTQAAGLFALDYDSPAGTRRALYTQFENSDARRFIPCWDEPAFKTTFDLVAVVPAEQMAISNMPVAQRTTRDDGTARIVFAPSPKMSSYLLFFGLGEFERAIATQGTTEIGVVTQRGKTAQAAFALESATAILVEYNDYFDTPYPLPKLDNVAGPGSSQFFGAMENWGAIFTFENRLLLDPAISTQDDRQSVFDVAAHEMAHQWFGNLVTMRWWDDLWLNEGFASWLQGRTTEKLHPEWNTALKFVAVRERAMERDALVTTHPVVQHIA